MNFFLVLVVRTLIVLISEISLFISKESKTQHDIFFVHEKASDTGF